MPRSPTSLASTRAAVAVATARPRSTLALADPGAVEFWAPHRWHPQIIAPVVTPPSREEVAGVNQPAMDDLFAELHRLAPGTAGWNAARLSLVEWYLPMAAHLGRKFSGRGEPVADLTQVAAIGLIKAVERYDLSRGVPFPAYAYPTIIGELKRYFRDSTWNIRVPRGMQELTLRLNAATEETTSRLQRSPTAGELAAKLGITIAELHQVRCAAGAYRTVPAEQSRADGEPMSVVDAHGQIESGFDMVDQRVTLRLLLADLPAREQRIISLRFIDNMTQSQIAGEMGISQMHVSRLLSRSLSRLRQRMLDDTPDGDVVLTAA
jgi:RNA polymerase sigma-B factor